MSDSETTLSTETPTSPSAAPESSAAPVDPAAAASAENAAPKLIVNPIALQNCFVRMGEHRARVLDISFVRVVIEATPEFSARPDGETMELDFALDRWTYKAMASVRARGDGWLRLGFDRIAPSARSLMRSFLSPKKIGESIVEDWRDERLRHYHGLNESEVWFDPDGSILFTYLDSTDGESQFILRMTESKGPLAIGKILRKDYMGLSRMDADLPLLPLTDREVYLKLSECRDIVTNIRPAAQMEYSLKQRLLRAISDSLYSTSHRVEMHSARPVRTSATPNVES